MPVWFPFPDGSRSLFLTTACIAPLSQRTCIPLSYDRLILFRVDYMCNIESEKPGVCGAGLTRVVRGYTRSMIRVNRANLMRLKIAFGREPRTRWVVDTRSLWQSAGSWLMNFCLSTTRYISFFSLYDYSSPPPPFDAVIHVQESPPYKRFLVGCSSPFMRLAEHLTALRAWSVNTLRAPSLHYKEARVDGHTTTAMHDLNEYPPPPPLPLCAFILCPG